MCRSESAKLSQSGGFRKFFMNFKAKKYVSFSWFLSSVDLMDMVMSAFLALGLTTGFITLDLLEVGPSIVDLTLVIAFPRFGFGSNDFCLLVLVVVLHGRKNRAWFLGCFYLVCHRGRLVTGISWLKFDIVAVLGSILGCYPRKHSGRYSGGGSARTTLSTMALLRGKQQLSPRYPSMEPGSNSALPLGLDAITVVFAYTFRWAATGYHGAVRWMWSRDYETWSYPSLQDMMEAGEHLISVAGDCIHDGLTTDCTPFQEKSMVYFFNRFYFCMSLRSLFAVTMLVYIQDIVGRGWGYGISARTVIIDVINRNLTDPANPEDLNGYGNSTVPHTTKFSRRDIYTAGFTNNTAVADCVQNNNWSWPEDWFIKYPILSQYQVPKINADIQDKMLWCLNNGTLLSFNPTGFNGKASLPSVLCKPEKIDSDVLKKMKTPRQAVKGVQGGLKMMFKLTKQVYQGVFKKNRVSLSGKKKQTGLTREELSNSNPFDALITVENDNELRTNGGNSNLVEKGANNDVVCSTHATSPVAFGGPTITPLVEWINDLERQMLDGMPSTSMREQVEDSNSYIEDLDDETTRYLASTNQAGGGGWNAKLRMKKYNVPSPFLLMLIVLARLTTSSKADESDISCLRSIKEHLEDPLQMLSTWKFDYISESSVCGFTGVKCWNGQQNRVLSIQLANMRLRGPFLMGIRNYTSMQELDL
ncbi:NRT1/ PTR family protein 6.4 [Tanacetum coccineum]